MLCNLIQFDIVWEKPADNLRHLSEMLENEPPSEGSLVLLPEMFATGFSMNVVRIAQSMDDFIVTWLKNTAKKYKVLIAGSVAISENNQFYNRFVWAFPDGHLACYNKRHLFRMGGEHDAYQAGDERLILQYQGFRILPLVCYDLRFPVWSRNRNDYDVIVYAANWPSARANVWNTLLLARAIENQSFVIGVNRVGDGSEIACCGNSQVVDYKGNVIIKGEGHQELILKAQLNLNELQAFRHTFPVWQDADFFNIIQ